MYPQEPVDNHDRFCQCIWQPVSLLHSTVLRIYFTPQTIARHSRSIVGYFLFPSDSFLLAKATGKRLPPRLCNSTAPTPLSEASVHKMNCLSMSGSLRIGFEASSSFKLLKAFSCTSPHSRTLGWPFRVISVSDTATAGEVCYVASAEIREPQGRPQLRLGSRSGRLKNPRHIVPNGCDGTLSDTVPDELYTRGSHDTL